MKTKVFEIRDKATFFPALAVKLEPTNDAEYYLIRRAGFALPTDLILFAHLEDTQISYDPHFWTYNRSRNVAHDYIAKHFDELEAGAVIDVEFILGETEAPKVSERVA